MHKVESQEVLEGLLAKKKKKYPSLLLVHHPPSPHNPGFSKLGVSFDYLEFSKEQQQQNLKCKFLVFPFLGIIFREKGLAVLPNSLIFPYDYHHFEYIDLFML